MSDKAAEVSEVVNAFSDCWNRHDMPAFAALFAEDAQFINPKGEWWRGREAIRQAHECTHASLFRHSCLSFTRTLVRFPADGLALARSEWVLEGQVSPEGAPLAPRTGLLLNVLVRGDEGWRIVESQNTGIAGGVSSRSS